MNGRIQVDGIRTATASELEFWQHIDDGYTPPSQIEEPRETEYRNGFHLLKRTDPKLYRSLRNHFSACFDRYDYGWKNEDGVPLHLNEKDALNYWLDSRNKSKRRSPQHDYDRLRSLSLKKIERHCKNEETYYYTSSPHGKWALLMLDVDDKDGRAGPEKVAEVHQYLNTLFPSHYNQVSTGGRGWHGYVLVRYPEMTVEAFRVLVKDVEHAIQAQVRALFPELYEIAKKPFEIKGLPGLLNATGGYKTCGLLAKIPRLGSDEEIASYMSTMRRYWTPDDLRGVLTRLSAPPSLPSPTDIDMRTGVLATENAVPISISVGEEREGDDGGRDGDWHPDPCTRMNKCGWSLSLRLKRPATAEEIWDEYHLRGWHTGEDDDGNRRRLAKESAEWCAQHFDPSKQKGFEGDAAISLVEAHLTPEIRKAIYKSNRSRYTSEQAAVVLHVIERASLSLNRRPDLQFTVPNNSLLAMFQTLQIPFGDEGADEANRKKLAAIKSALVATGLVEVVNANWCQGKGKCFGLGQKHPQYDEYKKLKAAMKADELVGVPVDHKMKADDVVGVPVDHNMKASNWVWVEMTIKGVSLRIQLEDPTPEKLERVREELKNRPTRHLPRLNGAALYR